MLNALVDTGKYNEFSVTQNKLIMFSHFHKSCPFESRILSYNNSPKSMINILLESLKNIHNVERTVHTANSVGRSSKASPWVHGIFLFTMHCAIPYPVQVKKKYTSKYDYQSYDTSK